MLRFAADSGTQRDTSGGVDSLPRDEKLYAWPCGSFERAAVNEPVAQLVEQRPFKAWVVRSIRTGLTTRSRNSRVKEIASSS